MAEVYTYTGTRLAADVKDKFGDTGAVQITDSMILRWINNGIQAIVAQTPFLKASAQTNVVAGTSTYSLGSIAQRVQQFDTVSFDGNPLKFVPWSEFQTHVHGGTALVEGIPEFASEYGGTITIWPKPAESITNGLTVYFVQYPEQMTDLTDTLPVPDRFYNALLDWVHAQALELEDNFQGAQVKLSQHEVHMQRQFERENRSPTEFYPTITADPDDQIVGYWP